MINLYSSHCTPRHKHLHMHTLLYLKLALVVGHKVTQIKSPAEYLFTPTSVVLLMYPIFIFDADIGSSLNQGSH